jgi:L-lactate utilization protein LutC
MARFAESLAKVKGEARCVADLGAALGALGDLLEEVKATAVVANDEAPLNGIDPAARWPAIAWHVVGKSEGELRAFCAGADAGVSGVSAALAETGSLVIEGGPGRSRMATLLPPLHVALVPASKLTPDIYTWTAGRRGTLPSSVTIVTGPSKTADIEFTLTLGAHGPKRLVALVYGEGPESRDGEPLAAERGGVR